MNKKQERELSKQEHEASKQVHEASKQEHESSKQVHELSKQERLSINQWAEDDRPREKLERLGAEALSNAELLAILIGSGSARETAVDLMKRVLADCGNNLSALGRLGVQELVERYSGIGPAKAITIMAAVELGRRRQMERSEERPQVLSSADVFRIMHPKLRDLSTEEGWVLLLNASGRLIKAQRVSAGGLTETLFDIRLILKEALLANATSLLICHNHPSGSVRPSREDDRLTMMAKAACETMRIPLRDHCIIADGCYYSYMDEGRL